MAQFVENSKNLPGFGHTVVDKDYRIVFVVQAKTGKLVIIESILENIDTAAREGIPPGFDSRIRIFPGNLGLKIDLEKTADFFGKAGAIRGFGKSESAEKARRFFSIPVVQIFEVKLIDFGPFVDPDDFGGHGVYHFLRQGTELGPWGAFLGDCGEEKNRRGALIYLVSELFKLGVGRTGKALLPFLDDGFAPFHLSGDFRKGKTAGFTSPFEDVEVYRDCFCHISSLADKNIYNVKIDRLTSFILLYYIFFHCEYIGCLGLVDHIPIKADGKLTAAPSYFVFAKH
jgi:hypothetical protein